MVVRQVHREHYWCRQSGGNTAQQWRYGLLAVDKMDHGLCCYFFEFAYFLPGGIIEARKLRPDRFALQYQQYYSTNN